MDFFIKQNATLPLLKVKVSKDGRSDFENFQQSLSSSTIYFSMIDVDTGIPKITRKYVDYIFNNAPNGVSPSEIFLYVKFSHKDTKKPGRYKIQFNIQNATGSVLLPLTEDIFVNVSESFITEGVTYSSDYIINDPCCLKIEDLYPVNYLITQDGDKITTQDGYFIIVIL